MKHTLPLILLALFAATSAQAACYADYKAKRDNPLRLHYGVTQLGDTCTPEAAQAKLQPLLAADGWTLLTVLGVFDETGLEERKASAGDNFLRY